MTGSADRYLYLARHGGASHDETALTGAGRRPAALLVHNDLEHLPPELRWTGFSPEQRL